MRAIGNLSTSLLKVTIKKVDETLNSPPPPNFQFIARNLALDCCNIVGGKRGVVDRPEKLTSYSNLLLWAEKAGVLGPQEISRLAAASQQHPEKASSVVKQAILLREALYRIFLAVIAAEGPADSDLAVLNSELGRGLGCLRIAPGKERRGFALEDCTAGERLDAPLGAIARAGADLLTNAEALDKLRQCQGDSCGWLFLDSSKNHSRRWCDMRDCGNRAKVKRHRLKQKEEKQT